MIKTTYYSSLTIAPTVNTSKTIKNFFQELRKYDAMSGFRYTLKKKSIYIYIYKINLLVNFLQAIM